MCFTVAGSGDRDDADTREHCQCVEMSYSEFGLVVPGTGLEPARLLGTGS